MRKSRKKPKATTILTYGDELLTPPNGWSLVDGHLMREWAFADFDSAKGFVDRVGELANEHSHHPEIHFGWGYVVLELMTHDRSAVTELDHKLAAAINQLDG